MGNRNAKKLTQIYIFFTIFKRTEKNTSNFFDCAEMIYFSFHARYNFCHPLTERRVEIIQLLKGMKNKWGWFENGYKSCEPFFSFTFVPHYIYLFDIYLIRRKCTCRLLPWCGWVERRRNPDAKRHQRHSFESCFTATLPGPMKGFAPFTDSAMFIHRCHLQSNIEM